MKKITFKLVLLVILANTTCLCYGQTEKGINGKNSFAPDFLKVMEAKVRMIDSSINSKLLETLTADFERIALAEKKQWLPYYYASLGHIKIGTMMAGGQNKTEIDQRAEKAERLLNSAIELSRESSETWCLKSMIATLRLIADPMSRWQQYGQLSEEAINKAEQLNPNNPRVFVLRGEDKFYTPEEYGGNKKQAKEYLEKAIRLFEIFKPESIIHPNWGKNQTYENLKQIKL